MINGSEIFELQLLGNNAKKQIHKDHNNKSDH